MFVGSFYHHITKRSCIWDKIKGRENYIKINKSLKEKKTRDLKTLEEKWEIILKKKKK